MQCIYFVALGTIDDLLWKLLETKFRDLGEFVEGKEKQKLVVHRTYHGVKDLYSVDTSNGAIAQVAESKWSQFFRSSVVRSSSQRRV